MACANQTLSGIGVPCEGSLGGIVEVYVTSWSDDLYTYDTSSASTGEVTAINTGVTWYVYHFRKNSSSMSQTRTIDAANGVNYVTTSVNLVFSRMDTAKRIEMNAMSLADMAVIVRDANGKYTALGMSEPVNASTGAGETGTARTDGNRYTVTLEDNYQDFPPFLSDAAIEMINLNED